MKVRSITYFFNPGWPLGDPIHFDFGFFADSRVMSLEAAPLSGLMAGDETFQIAHRITPENRSAI